MFRILGKSLDSWIIYSFLDKEWTKLGVQMEFTCHQLNWAILKGVLYFEVSIIPVQFVVEEITCLRDATSAIKNSKYLPILCNGSLTYGREQEEQDARAGDDPKVNESHSREQQKKKNQNKFKHHYWILCTPHSKPQY